MLIYWFLLLFPFLMIITDHNKIYTFGKFNIFTSSNFAWVSFFFILVITIGLRHQIGPDWYNYENMLGVAREGNFIKSIKFSDPGYMLLNIIGAKWGGLYLVNTFAALIFSYGLIRFCNRQLNPWLAILVAVPYLVNVVAMSYTRQSASIGFIFLGLIALADKKYFKFILLILLASSFHKSAIILLPLVIVSETLNGSIFKTFIIFLFVIFIYIIQGEYFINTIKFYSEQNLNSIGDIVRLSMTLIPSIIFIIFFKNFNLDSYQGKLWMLYSLSGFGLVLLLIFSSASAWVDRLGLFWIPLQIFILSRLPNIFKPGVSKFIITIIIISSYLAVAFVWLFYGQNTKHFLPYKSLLLT